jgi:hypothetical protein
MRKAVARRLKTVDQNRKRSLIAVLIERLLLIALSKEVFAVRRFWGSLLLPTAYSLQPGVLAEGAHP